MSDLSQESPLWREWAESRHSVQQMREELDRLRSENARLIGDHAAALRLVTEARPCVEEIADQVDCTAPHKAASIYALLARIDAALAKAGVK